MARSAALSLILVVAIGCAPRACDDADSQMACDVEILLGESASAADAAQARLVARGRAAIVMLETGLYQAEPPGRRRIVAALVAIGHPDAVPILRHLAGNDPDEAVRAHCEAALTALAAP